MKQGEIKTELTSKETKALCAELVRLFNDGYQNTLTWKTRGQLQSIVTNYIMYEMKPDLRCVTKEGLKFILNIVPNANAYTDYNFDALLKTIRKRAYKVIETRTKLYYNM